MCLAWLRGEGKPAVPVTYLDALTARNPDGFGLAYASGGVLHVQKFLPSERTAFIAAYRAVESAGVTVVGHARFATTGSRSRENAHPFVYTDPAGFDVAVVHNGMLSIEVEGDMTDSEAFVRKVLADLPSRWWTSPSIRYLVSETLGRSNKFLLLTAEGETVIINEAQGTWKDDVWYSQTYSLPYAPAVKWTPLVKPAATVRQPSKREQKRAAKAAHKATKVGGSRRPASMPVERSLTVVRRSLNLTHMGHIVDALDDLPVDTDGDYPGSLLCTVCHTLGDAYVVDGQRYFDLSHLAGVPHDDALSAAGM